MQNKSYEEQIIHSKSPTQNKSSAQQTLCRTHSMQNTFYEGKILRRTNTTQSESYAEQIRRRTNPAQISEDIIGSLQHSAPHYNTPQHVSTHCNTLQPKLHHTATHHCNKTVKSKKKDKIQTLLKTNPTQEKSCADL